LDLSAEPWIWALSLGSERWALDLSAEPWTWALSLGPERWALNQSAEPWIWALIFIDFHWFSLILGRSSKSHDFPRFGDSCQKRLSARPSKARIVQIMLWTTPPHEPWFSTIEKPSFLEHFRASSRNRWKSPKIAKNQWKSMKINENQWKSLKITKNH